VWYNIIPHLHMVPNKAPQLVTSASVDYFSLAISLWMSRAEIFQLSSNFRHKVV
jgi:hypothetical protein